ncbi:MAG TPA: beta-ketoacyl-ACP synthase [Anaerolineae bacterium]|nr:beta-ketoacyl-ACP synthase [Anaerolineae bacterium]
MLASCQQPATPTAESVAANPSSDTEHVASSSSGPAVITADPTPAVVHVSRNVGDLSATSNWTVNRGLTEEAKECISCHQEEHPGIVQDWKDSRHGHVNVTCIDCHQVEADSPTATQHETLIGTDTYISVLVPPSKCATCHPAESEQFKSSGHFRAFRQIIPKDSLHALVQKHEGQNNSEFGNASDETGCMQCHGTEIKLGDDNRPLSSTWPNAGIGNIYPDGSTGNCSTCHTRHKFSIEEARKPVACASCHLGPDHPDIEIFENSKHGQIYLAEGDSWEWSSAPDAWEPGDYRAPTCATCHMSGIGELSTTHNISERLYWNLWAKESKVRNSTDPLSPLLGDGPAGREKMKLVCDSCHTSLHTDNFFEQGDRAVQLYNVAYYQPAEKMRAELAEKGLLKDNPWTDEFQIVYYHLWHHEGRRARQGAMMGGPDYAHWHGFFELQQDLYKLEELYNKRIETGKIEG